MKFFPKYSYLLVVSLCFFLVNSNVSEAQTVIFRSPSYPDLPRNVQAYPSSQCGNKIDFRWQMPTYGYDDAITNGPTLNGFYLLYHDVPTGFNIYTLLDYYTPSYGTVAQGLGVGQLATETNSAGYTYLKYGGYQVSESYYDPSVYSNGFANYDSVMYGGSSQLQINRPTSGDFTNNHWYEMDGVSHIVNNQCSGYIGNCSYDYSVRQKVDKSLGFWFGLQAFNSYGTGSIMWANYNPSSSWPNIPGGSYASGSCTPNQPYTTVSASSQCGGKVDITWQNPQSGYSDPTIVLSGQSAITSYRVYRTPVFTGSTYASTNYVYGERELVAEVSPTTFKYTDSPNSTYTNYDVALVPPPYPSSTYGILKNSTQRIVRLPDQSSGLVFGAYHYYVVAVNSSGESEEPQDSKLGGLSYSNRYNTFSAGAWYAPNTIRVSGQCPPAPPANFQANTSSQCGGKVDLSWDPATINETYGPPTTYYYVYRSTDPNTINDSNIATLYNYSYPSGVWTYSATTTYADVVEYTPNTLYYYMLKALNNAYTGPNGPQNGYPMSWSGFATSSIVSATSSNVCTPLNVAVVTGDSYSCGRIKVGWGYVSGANGYKIYRSDSSDGTFTQVATSTSYGNYAFTNDGLFASTTYYYKVASYTNSGAISEMSPIVSTTTSDCRPMNLVATTSSSCGNVKLSWNYVSAATGYKVYRSDSPNGIFTQVATTTNYYNYNDLVPVTGTTYYYKVAAYTSSGVVSTLSSVASSTSYECKPVNLRATTGSSCGSVRLDWNSISSANGYKIYRSDSSDGTFTQVGTSTSYYYNYFNDVPPVVNMTYYYKVASYTTAGFVSPLSDATSSVPLDCTPANVIAAPGESCGSIDLSWDYVSSAYGYNVYRSESPTGEFSRIGAGYNDYYCMDYYTCGYRGYYRDYSPSSFDVPYYYKVTSYGSDGIASATSSVASSVPSDCAPTNLTATEGDGCNINLSWDSVPDVYAYNIYRSTSPYGDFSQIGTGYEQYYCIDYYTCYYGGYYNDTDSLNAGVDYYYKIASVHEYSDWDYQNDMYVSYNFVSSLSNFSQIFGPSSCPNDSGCSPHSTDITGYKNVPISVTKSYWANGVLDGLQKDWVNFSSTMSNGVISGTPPTGEGSSFDVVTQPNDCHNPVTINIDSCEFTSPVINVDLGTAGQYDSGVTDAVVVGGSDVTNNILYDSNTGMVAIDATTSPLFVGSHTVMLDKNNVGGCATKRYNITFEVAYPIGFGVSTLNVHKGPCSSSTIPWVKTTSNSVKKIEVPRFVTSCFYWSVSPTAGLGADECIKSSNILSAGTNFEVSGSDLNSTRTFKLQCGNDKREIDLIVTGIKEF